MSNQIFSNGYYHATPGRLRVRVTNLKNRLKTAKSLEVLLMSEPGVKHVRANHVTGNVLVVFDERITYHKAILAALANIGHRPLICKRTDACAEAEAEADAICELGVTIGKRIARMAIKQALMGSPALILLDLL